MQSEYPAAPSWGQRTRRGRVAIRRPGRDPFHGRSAPLGGSAPASLRGVVHGALAGADPAQA